MSSVAFLKGNLITYCNYFAVCNNNIIHLSVPPPLPAALKETFELLRHER